MVQPSPPHRAEALVIIPTYNEKENVASMVEALFGQYPEGLDLLVVDDNSPDGTALIVKELQEKYPDRLFLLERAGKEGLGTAYIAGFRWALDRQYSYIAEMDCDFSHPVDKLGVLIDACRRDVDVAIGSRYVPGGRVVNWPRNRIFISKGASLYVRLITAMPVKDATAGFVCYRREVLAQLDLSQIHFRGYGFQIEMKYLAYIKGFRIKEIPITFVNRVLGDSKMSSRIFGEAFWGVIKLRLWHYKGLI